MELALGALAKVAGGLFGSAATSAGTTAATTAASTAATTTAAAAGSGLSWGTILSGTMQGLSLGTSVLSKIAAGNAAASETELMVIQNEMAEDREKVLGEQQQTSMKRELARVLGQNQVAAANAGIDISAGITQQANAAAKKAAQTQMSIARSDSEFQSAMYRLKAQGLRTKADNQRSAGLLGAFGDIANFGIDLYQRG